MRKLLIAALALSISFLAAGQGKVGIVGGYTSAKMSLSEEIKSWSIKSAPGYHLGVAYYCPLALGFAIQPQIMYSSKSSEVEGFMKNKVGYVEVPVQLQWGIDLIVAKPYVFVEPYAGLAISGSVQDIQSSKKTKINFDNRLEYGFSLGAGMMIARHVQLSFKYFWNLDNTGIPDDVVLDEGASPVEKRFKGLAVSAGIFF